MMEGFNGVDFMAASIRRTLVELIKRRRTSR